MKGCESWAGERQRATAGGFAPRPPGFIAFVPEFGLWSGLGERVDLAPDQIPAPGSALRSHPCVALSSAQASRSIRPGRRSYKRRATRIDDDRLPVTSGRQGHFQDLVPSALQGGDRVQLRQGNGNTILQGGVRAEEIVVGDEQSSQRHGTILGFEAAGGTDMVFVGAVETFDQLLERAKFRRDRRDSLARSPAAR